MAVGCSDSSPLLSAKRYETEQTSLSGLFLNVRGMNVKGDLLLRINGDTTEYVGPLLNCLPECVRVNLEDRHTLKSIHGLVWSGVHGWPKVRYKSAPSECVDIEDNIKRGKDIGHCELTVNQFFLVAKIIFKHTPNATIPIRKAED